MTYGATRVPRRAGVELVVLVLVACTAPAMGAGSQTSVYTGERDGDRRVVFEVTRKGGRPASGVFKAMDWPIACSGVNEVKRTTFRPIRVEFHSARAFEATRYIVTAKNERYYRVEGRLGSRGRANGLITFISNSDAPDQPDCFFNAGPLEWEARKR
jgi:hypothetical protein